jgi:hypothetical protein
VRETTETESQNYGYKFGQEEETYNIVAAHGYFGRLIFRDAIDSGDVKRVSIGFGPKPYSNRTPNLKLLQGKRIGLVVSLSFFIHWKRCVRELKFEST